MASPSAASQLGALSLSSPSSLSSVLPQLLPTSSADELRSAHLALAQLAGLSFSSAPTPPATPVPGERLGADEAQVLLAALHSSQEQERLAALRALGILAGLAPEAVQPLLASLLPSLLAAAASPDIAALLVGAFLATLASHADARAALRESRAVRQWCDTWLDHGELAGANASDEDATRDIALLAGLVRIKLGGAAAPQPAAAGAPLPEDEEEIGSAEARAEATLRAKEERQKEKEAQREWEANEVEELRGSLFALAKARLLAAEKRGAQPAAVADELPFDEEVRHATFMAALEALAHLSGHMKAALASDAPLLSRLCSPTLLGASASRRPVFPQRQGSAAGASGASSYDADPSLPSARTDGAASYALASILCALVAPPPILSAQEAQMAALRAKASNTPLAPREEPAVVEARALQVLAAGGAAALVRLVAASNGATSAATRDACALALLGLCAPQARAARAQIAKEGGAKALLALCSLSTTTASAEQESHDEARATQALIAAQALARLCISLPTPALFSAPTAPLRVLSLLFLSAHATPLQRFEACLALTNVASLPGLAGDVARANHAGVTVEQALRERIVAPHRMERRAAVELLCNLAQDEQVHRVWSGEMEDEADAEDKSTTTTPTTTRAEPAKGRLHVLLALCAPSASSSSSSDDDEEEEQDADAGEKGTAAESTLKTRLAASGALATLLSSPSACSRLLSLRASSLAILARLLEPRVEPPPPPQGARIQTLEEEKEEEKEKRARERERVAEEVDARFAGMGHEEAARKELRIRAAAAMGCVAQYAAWLGSHSTSHSKASSNGNGSGGAEARQLKEMREKLGQACWLEALRMRRAERGEVGEMCDEALGLFGSVGVQ